MPGAILTPMRVERRALTRRLDLPVHLTGRGTRAAFHGGQPALLAGVAGGLAPWVRPGDLVVADHIIGQDARFDCPGAPMLAGALRRYGHVVHVGPILTTPSVVDGTRRARAAATGALAVDTESAFVAAGLPAGTLTVVRSIVDTQDRPLRHPGTVSRGFRALRALSAVGPALRAWSRACTPRLVLRGGPDTAAATFAERCDLVLVLGAADSSHSRRAVAVIRDRGTDAHLVDDPASLDLAWLNRSRRIGVLADASAAPDLADRLLRCLASLGEVAGDEITATHQDARFSLPREVS